MMDAPHVAYIALDGQGQQPAVNWDASKGERCMLTRDESGEHYSTWRVLDVNGSELRRGTWRVKHWTENQLRQHAAEQKRQRKRK